MEAHVLSIYMQNIEVITGITNSLLCVLIILISNSDESFVLLLFVLIFFKFCKWLNYLCSNLQEQCQSYLHGSRTNVEPLHKTSVDCE